MQNAGRHLSGQILVCLFLGLFAASAVSAPLLSLAPAQSTDGKATLSWELPEGASVEVESSLDDRFVNVVPLYQGSDRSTVLTGLSDGSYHFRARITHQNGAISPWGEPVSLLVEHHSLVKAVSFFVIGAVVFVATLLLIILGARREQ
ncbi:MAG: fibronectin type III domain-containing protein [Candidatus Thiodiazotropha weberae]|nr:fibronectin type III domain-containing protein [Candidatus Thiodiazotropha weberae]